MRERLARCAWLAPPRGIGTECDGARWSGREDSTAPDCYLHVRWVARSRRSVLVLGGTPHDVRLPRPTEVRMFSLFPKEEDFFVLFQRQAALVREGCNQLHEMMDRFDDLEG